MATEENIASLEKQYKELQAENAALKTSSPEKRLAAQLDMAIDTTRTLLHDNARMDAADSSPKQADVTASMSNATKPFATMEGDGVRITANGASEAIILTRTYAIYSELSVAKCVDSCDNKVLWSTCGLIDYDIMDVMRAAFKYFEHPDRNQSMSDFIVLLKE